MKEFNTTGLCVPSRHYMVDITGRVLKIKQLIDKDKYFTINRPRQYGKTTILNAVYNAINDVYNIIDLSLRVSETVILLTKKVFALEYIKIFAAVFLYQMMFL